MAVNSNGVFYMNDTNTETFTALMEQLDRILGFGKRSDGKWYLADACQSSRINKWAKFKPLKGGPVSNLSEADRIGLRQGLYLDSNYYFQYDRVVSGYWSRIRDFDGYNDAAIPPIGDTSKYNLTLSFSGGSSGKIVFDPNNLMVSGAEISLSELGTLYNYSRWYVGVAFLNKSTNKGFYHTYEWTLDAILNGEASASESVGLEANAPNVVNNGEYHMYYCLGQTANVAYGSLTTSMIGSSIFLFACDANHGHAVVTAKKMGWSYIDSSKPNVTCSYSGTGSASIIIPSVTIKCTWDFTSFPYTNEVMQFQAKIGETTINANPQSLILGATNTVKFTQSVIISASDVVDYYEYVVPITLYGKFQTESSYSIMGYGTYNVQSKTFVSWANYY